MNFLTELREIRKLGYEIKADETTKSLCVEKGEFKEQLDFGTLYTPRTQAFRIACEKILLNELRKG